MAYRVRKTDVEWRAQLTDEQYRVTREGGTERPFTGQYWKSMEPGVYRCVCCGEELFTHRMKFESMCGWPSFDRELDSRPIERLRDTSHGMIRTEVRCGSCGAHLGHVFEDGPTETGERYCINSAAIVLEPE
ncbi:MAG: peptide-methionine (R)-S-oxide reductase [Deltaproteobacteria bacterium]|nr:MAG: peptide-methionine (R)-S-oxide reductase [Deltaproteobacteria bacterium]